MKKIAIDLDDVIYDMKPLLNTMMDMITDKKIHYSKWNNFDFTKVYGETICIDTVLSSIVEHKIMNHQDQVCLDSDIAMDRIAELYEIHIITSRGYCDHAFELTTDWLNNHNIPYHKLHIVKNGQTKSEIINDQIGFVDFFVDDHLKNLQDVFDNCSVGTCVVIDQPWNLSDKRFPRAKNLFNFTCKFID